MTPKTPGERLTVWRRENPIRRWMDENGLTNQDVAALARVNRLTLRAWLNGARPQIDRLEALAAQMGISAAEAGKRLDKWRDRRP